MITSVVVSGGRRVRAARQHRPSAPAHQPPTAANGSRAPAQAVWRPGLVTLLLGLSALAWLLATLCTATSTISSDSPATTTQRVRLLAATPGDSGSTDGSGTDDKPSTDGAPSKAKPGGSGSSGSGSSGSGSSSSGGDNTDGAKQTPRTTPDRHGDGTTDQPVRAPAATRPSAQSGGTDNQDNQTAAGTNQVDKTRTTPTTGTGDTRTRPADDDARTAAGASRIPAPARAPDQSGTPPPLPNTVKPANNPGPTGTEPTVQRVSKDRVVDDNPDGKDTPRVVPAAARDNRDHSSTATTADITIAPPPGVRPSQPGGTQTGTQTGTDCAAGSTCPTDNPTQPTPGNTAAPGTQGSPPHRGEHTDEDCTASCTNTLARLFVPTLTNGSRTNTTSNAAHQPNGDPPPDPPPNTPLPATPPPPNSPTTAHNTNPSGGPGGNNPTTVLTNSTPTPAVTKPGPAAELLNGPMDPANSQINARGPPRDLADNLEQVYGLPSGSLRPPSTLTDEQLYQRGAAIAHDREAITDLVRGYNPTVPPTREQLIEAGRQLQTQLDTGEVQECTCPVIATPRVPNAHELFNNLSYVPLPQIGSAAALTEAYIYYKEGNKGEALLAAASAIPVFKSAGKAGKGALKAGEEELPKLIPPHSTNRLPETPSNAPSATPGTKKIAKQGTEDGAEASGSPSPSVTSAIPAPAKAHGADVPEIFYRGMSNAEYQGLLANGGLSVRGESFVTQDPTYVEQLAARWPDKYETFVQFHVEPGTRRALIDSGYISRSNIVDKAGLGGLPSIVKGMSGAVVHIKGEKGAINYGLRPGSAHIFNDRILEIRKIR